MSRLRLTFKCWNCDSTFQLTRELAGQPRLLIDCPYCAARCVYDLDHYRDSKTEVLRGTEIDLEKETLNLPEVIVTTEPSEEDVQ